MGRDATEVQLARVWVSSAPDCRADPAAAYMLEISTSIPVESAGDDAQLKAAIASAIDDVLHHAIAFTPTLVTLQTARVIGDLEAGIPTS